MNETTNRTRSKRSLVLAVLLLGAVLALLLHFRGPEPRPENLPPIPINTLPPDEELIAWFQANRADIEELVRRYRAYVPPEGKGHNEWEKLDDTPELFKRAGVHRFSEISPAWWLPDPYSAEARQKDGGYLAVDWRHAAKYVTLAIHPADRRFNHNSVWKDLAYFPEPPRIQNGFIVEPLNKSGVSPAEDRVFPTLNNEPPDVARDTCAFRQIEPQWFIRMCRVIY